MKKLLTIIIPTYNMEKYLSRCLESLIIEDEFLRDGLEVLVVIDGATDNSSQIAHDFEQKYPEVFKVIDKPNGHYGSCINAGLKEANGKYFKILDADDWYNKYALVDTLKALEKTNTDAVFTRFTLVYEDGKDKALKGNGDLPLDTELSLEQIELPRLYQEMHGLMFLTRLLKDINYKQTEGICYTDTEFVYYPLMSSKSITILPYDLYQYRIGRDEQTISLKSLAKNIKHFEMIVDRLLESKFNNIDSYLINCFKERMILNIFIIGILLNPSNVDYRKITRYINEVYQMPSPWKEELLDKKVHGIKFVRIWARFSKPISDILLFPLRLYYSIKIK